MDILPAIDLRDGKCVRLLQGDYNRQIDYNDDPVTQARHFEEQGAKWLHVVDLDGALQGKIINHAVIKKIVSTTQLNVEVGGGIREESMVEELLDNGVTRVIIGTRAMEEPDWFKELVHNYPQKIVLGLDAREGYIATRGWTRTGKMTIEEMAETVDDWPLSAIVYTDISRDGMLTGPNIETTRRLAEHCCVGVIASGGVGCLDHIRELAPLPIAGVIVGRALYEGSFTLKEALAVIQ